MMQSIRVTLQQILSEHIRLFGHIITWMITALCVIYFTEVDDVWTNAAREYSKSNNEEYEPIWAVMVLTIVVLWYVNILLILYKFLKRWQEEWH